MNIERLLHGRSRRAALQLYSLYVDQPRDGESLDSYVKRRTGKPSDSQPKGRGGVWDRLGIEQCGENAAKAIDERDPKGFWHQFKDEFHLLVCSDEPKYGPLRKKLSTLGGKSQLVIVSTMAAGMASVLGTVATAALVPLCVVCMMAVIRVGGEAYCRSPEIPRITVGDVRNHKAKRAAKPAAGSVSSRRPTRPQRKG